jgi:hypothetical protein
MPQSQLEINFTRAEQNRNVGMLLAEIGVDREWTKQAYLMLQDFLNCTYQQTFLSEDIREWCYKQGLTRPHSERVWGSLISQAQKDGLISFAGYEKTSNPKAHRAIAATWKKGAR